MASKGFSANPPSEPSRSKATASTGTGRSSAELQRILDECVIHEENEEIASSDTEDFWFNAIAITLPIYIAGDDNLVTIDPIGGAGKILAECLKAIRCTSEVKYGALNREHIGGPKPLRLSVTTPIHITGSRNRVGESAVAANFNPEEPLTTQGVDKSVMTDNRSEEKSRATTKGQKTPENFDENDEHYLSCHE